jgi:glycosyltransferase involved in cell wall biosynthesis
MEQLQLSVVIPVYNEEENIPILVQELEETLTSLGKSYEVIFVDDGSQDNSLKHILEACRGNPRIRVISFEENAGQTAAMDAGFRNARGDVIVTMDADLQNSPRDIPLLLEKIPEYDMVFGWRAVRNDPWVRRFSSVIANTTRNLLSQENIKDITCSLKAYKRECFQRIKLYHGMHRFLPTLFKMEGYRAVEVRVNHYPRRYGVSKYNIRNRLFRSFMDLLAVRWMKKRKLNYRIRDLTRILHE